MANFTSLLSDPRFLMGMGLLGSGGRMQGGFHGLQMANQMQAMKGKKSLRDLQMEQIRAQMIQKTQAQERQVKMRAALGTPQILQTMESMGGLMGPPQTIPGTPGTGMFSADPAAQKQAMYGAMQYSDDPFANMLAMQKANKLATGKFGNTPIWGKDEQGNPVIMRFTPEGGIKQTELPAGVSASEPFNFMDFGSGITRYGKKTGKQYGTKQKDLSPVQTPEHRRSIKAAELIGKGEGDAQEQLETKMASLPRLYAVADELSALGKLATYTMAGQARDIAYRELGLDPGDAAVARKEYISKVDNEILPLLRQTFGAAFTEKEGTSLKATLGDPNASPREKDAVLRSFIQSKVEQIETLKRRVGTNDGWIIEEVD